MSGRKSGGPRRTMAKAAFIVLACAGACAAGRVLGGDWYWGGFAGAMVLIAAIVGRGARRPSVQTTVNAAGRDINTTNVRKTRLNINTGGVTAVLGAVLIVVVDGLLVAHVSTQVPGGRFYEPSEPVQAVGAPATARAPVFLRDLPSSQLHEPQTGWFRRRGARITGRPCARSVYVALSVIGRPATITLTTAAKYSRFKALAGVPDEDPPNVTIEFTLLGDDKVVATRNAGPRKPAVFDEDISPYTTLNLRTALIAAENGTEPPDKSHDAVWGDAQLVPSGGTTDGCLSTG
ncbi:hypothetical protein ABTW95_00835 [Spirillospora sp. NPDC127506]|uniref:hypothetical protein n=1 Tax=Actinomadura sp. TaxID=1989 RepID=UPI00335EE53B